MAEHTLSFPYVDTYTYCPKPRESFSNGPIKAIMEKMTNPRLNEYRNLLDNIDKFTNKLSKISLCQENNYDPYWHNGFIPPLDGAMIYTLVAEKKPDIYFEIGSGNSTKFAYKAIRDNSLSTKIISVDPTPRAEIDEICDMIFRKGIEDFDLDFLQMLTPNSFVFCDNSHRAFANSDVTVFFTEIIPQLPINCIYALHDIYLPKEVYCDWFYNEQYMLATYLLGGAGGDKILFPTHYVNIIPQFNNKSLDVDNEKIYFNQGGSLFWMQKGEL